MNCLSNIFENHGFKVSRNIPFAGAYVTQRYGHPSNSKHVIQIEINRCLYLNEDKVLPSEDFEKFRDKWVQHMLDVYENSEQYSNILFKEIA